MQYNRENLEKLATYLENLPENYTDFGMRNFVFARDTKAEVNYALNNGGVHTCGTAACAVGHGPSAGILFDPSDTRLWVEGKAMTYPFGPNGVGLVSDEDVLRPHWANYSSYMFVDQGHYPTWWEWAFGANWRVCDDTPQGAAKRIRYMLRYIDEYYEPPVDRNFDDEDLYDHDLARYWMGLYQ